VGEPEIAIGGVEVMTDRIADSSGIDFSSRAIPVHANDAADPQTIIHLVLFDRLDVVGLAQRNIELVVRPDPADASGVIEAFLFLRDELSLGAHNAHRRVWPFE